MTGIVRISLHLILLTVFACGLCTAADNQFVILSDLHTMPESMDQMNKVTDEVISLKPAFVVQLGDVGNDEFPGWSVWQMRAIDESFQRIRQAGIEIHIAPGNHDFPDDKPGVDDIKRCWFCSQIAPYPMNDILDAEKNPTEYKRICLNEQYWYSFNWRGIHFVIVDSNDVRLDQSTKVADFSQEQKQWLENDLGKHANNPSKFPTLVFLHHPEIMTGDRGNVDRPLYKILDKYPDHTVNAVFGGHWHGGVFWPAKENAGANVYATPASVLHDNYTEYIVATAGQHSVTFEKVKVAAEKKKGENANRVEYLPVALR